MDEYVIYILEYLAYLIIGYGFYYILLVLISAYGYKKLLGYDQRFATIAKSEVTRKKGRSRNSDAVSEYWLVNVEYEYRDDQGELKIGHRIDSGSDKITQRYKGESIPPVKLVKKQKMYPIGSTIKVYTSPNNQQNTYLVNTSKAIPIRLLITSVFILSCGFGLLLFVK